MTDYSFYFITDRKLSRVPVIETVKQAIEGGATIVQYREKEKRFDEMKEEASKIFEVCRRASVPLIINDFPELAKAVDADGVHVGHKDAEYAEARKIVGKEKSAGVSATNFNDVARVCSLAFEGRKPDYVGFGPVFFTATKADASPETGLSELKRACDYCHSKSIPVVAIGGICIDNVASVVNTGADGVAVISAVLKTNDITGTVRKFKEEIRSARAFL
ncbi:thiamine phosphate synthase [Candidatus Micrarchaeota archaeon]|nr:thiamine phosphate synthase [Candidatus Micrarchaeota archaeon]